MAAAVDSISSLGRVILFCWYCGQSAAAIDHCGIAGRFGGDCSQPDCPCDRPADAEGVALLESFSRDGADLFWLGLAAIDGRTFSFFKKKMFPATIAPERVD